jgi:hypothetical protein
MPRVTRASALAFVLSLIVVPRLAAVDFRGASWLMSSEQVQAVEGGTPLSAVAKNGAETLVYRIYLGGKPGTLTYFFDANRLVSGSYTFGGDKDRSLYASLEKNLVAQLGPPAVQTGSMAAWRLPRTEVALTSLTDKSCYVVYWEKNYFVKVNGLASAEGRSAQ